MTTAADLLAMPDDGVVRWIIGGRLREKPSEFPEVPFFVRGRRSAGVLRRSGRQS